MQRAVLYVKQHGKSHSESVASFVEEGVVRRELSDNFCYYNQHYDSIEGVCADMYRNFVKIPLYLFHFPSQNKLYFSTKTQE
jgi:hypothetical protein